MKTSTILDALNLRPRSLAREVRLSTAQLDGIAAEPEPPTPSPRVFALRTGRRPQDLAAVLAAVDRAGLTFDLYDHWLAPLRAAR